MIAFDNTTETSWHTNLQRQFKTCGCDTEVKVEETKFKNYRRGDVLNSNRDVLELQHSPISKQEIENRIQDYSLKGHPNIYWLIDGTNFSVIERSDNRFLISLSYPWLHLSNLFCTCEFIFAYCNMDTKEFIVKFDPRSVRNGMVYVLESYQYLLEDFIYYFTNDYIILSEIPTPYRSCRLFLQQKPAGSGKTFGMVDRILNPSEHPKFNHYDTFIILTKPHSAKDVVRREFEEQLEKNKMKYDSGEENKAFWFLVQIANKQKLIILATGDSFMYRLGEKHNEYLDMFEGICKMIETKGPTKLGERGYVYFKGHSFNLNAQTLIICDEATKFDCHYADALGQIMFFCMADAYIIGDKLQSIEFDKNMLTYLIDTDDPFPHVEKIVEKDNVIRRFGRNLVNFLNTIIGSDTYEKYKLPMPISCDDENIQRDHEGEIEIMFLDMKSNIEQDKLHSAVRNILYKLDFEIESLYLLPHDILCVFPFVSNNPFGDFLRDRIDDFWISKLEDDIYRKHMLKSPYKNKALKFFTYFDEVKESKKNIREKYHNRGQQYEWLAFFHRSEEGKPVKTSESDQATRMVSIHAAQGDGRRLVFTFQLSECALKRFSNGKKNLIYDSLLNVSCSRAKTKQIVVLQEGENDDVISKFKPFLTSEQLCNIQPKLNLSSTFYISDPLFESYGKTIDKEWIPSFFDFDNKCFDYKSDIIEYEHHLIRNCTFHLTFTLCIYLSELSKTIEFPQIYTVLCKIYNLPIQQVDISEYYRILQFDDISCIPLIRYKRKHETCDAIFDICSNVKGGILKRIVRKDKTINMKEINPLECVSLWYMIQIFLNKKYSLLKMNTLVDIYSYYSFRYHSNMTTHYNYIEKASNVFNKILKNLPMDGRWNFNHTISLGKRDATYPDGGFKCILKIPFMYTTDSSCTALHIMPNITSLRIDEMATLVSYSGLFISQPFQDNTQKNKISGKNKDRFDGKEIKIYISSIEGTDENNNLQVFEWTRLEPYRHEIINVLSDWIFQKFFAQHDNIMDFVKYYKNKAQSQYEIECKTNNREPVKYVDNMLDRYCDDFEENKNNLSEYQADFKKKLDRKLNGIVKSFKESLI